MAGFFNVENFEQISDEKALDENNFNSISEEKAQK